MPNAAVEEKIYHQDKQEKRIVGSVDDEIMLRRSLVPGAKISYYVMALSPSSHGYVRKKMIDTVEKVYPHLVYTKTRRCVQYKDIIHYGA